MVDLNEKHGIYPTQDGGVVVISGGVAEVLDRPAARRRLAYAEDRRTSALGNHLESDNPAETEVALLIRDERVKAYRIALAHKENSRG